MVSEVLGCHRHGKNKERMAKIIASELRGSDESGDGGAANMSFEHCDPIRWWAGSHVQFPNLPSFALRHSFNTR